MGNSTRDQNLVPAPERNPANINLYFSDRSWIEGVAIDQLDQMSCLPGISEIAAFPDLHPGKYGATGVALLSQRLHPLLIGNDIGCGMSLFILDLPVRKLRIDKAEGQIRQLETHDIDNPATLLTEAGLPSDLFPQALGTIGGGNHFCELQAVECFTSNTDTGLDNQMVYLLVHSGSRSLGASVFSKTLSDHKELAAGLEAESETGTNWLLAHDDCVRWASLNRRMIARRVASALRTEMLLIADTPHNMIRPGPDGFVHYKGASAVCPGNIAPIAGSRDAVSYIVRATNNVTGSLGGISHGAGRKYDRSAMHGRTGRNRGERERLVRNSWGGVVICDDRNLLIEEAACAYKDCSQVIADLEAAQLIESLAAMRPLITYKKALHQAQAQQHARKPANRREGRR